MLESEFLEAINQPSGTQPYTANATVTRVDEDGTAWVHIEGGVDETPAIMAVDCKAGDTVRLNVTGGKAYVTGNTDRPPTDDGVAILSKKVAELADTKAVKAQETADTEARERTAIIHSESDGIHIDTPDGKTRAIYGPDGIEFMDESLASVAHYGNGEARIGSEASTHIHVDSDSLDIRGPMSEDGADGAVMATFGEHSAVIGEESGSHVSIDNEGTTIYDADGTKAVAISTLKSKTSNAVAGVIELANTKTGRAGTLWMQSSGINRNIKTEKNVSVWDSVDDGSSSYTAGFYAGHDSYIDFKATVDGNAHVRGKLTQGGIPKVLWSGAAYMSKGQYANLSEKVSDQPHGIVLHWAGWDPSTSKLTGTDHHYQFVPKTHVTGYSGTGIHETWFYNTGNLAISKYVYVSDSSLEGNDNNKVEVTRLVKFSNNRSVLVQVLGV